MAAQTFIDLQRDFQSRSAEEREETMSSYVVRWKDPNTYNSERSSSVTSRCACEAAALAFAKMVWESEFEITIKWVHTVFQLFVLLLTFWSGTIHISKDGAENHLRLDLFFKRKLPFVVAHLPYDEVNNVSHLYYQQAFRCTHLHLEVWTWHSICPCGAEERHSDVRWRVRWGGR